MLEGYYTRPQVAERLGISESRVRQIEKTYKVPFKKLGNYVLYKKEDIHDMEKKRVGNQKYNPNKK